MYYYKVHFIYENIFENIVKSCTFEDKNANFTKMLFDNENKNTIFCLNSRSVNDSIKISELTRLFNGKSSGTVYGIVNMKNAIL